MTEQVTINGQTYDTYATVAQADLRLQADFRLGPIWDAFDTNEKSQLLVTSTRMLDRANWKGERTDPAQPLDFPRTEIEDPDTGEPVPDDQVPGQIQTGSIDLAALIGEDPTIAGGTGTGSNVKRVKAGSAEVENFRPTSGTRFPTEVQQQVTGYLAGSGKSGGAQAVGLCDNVQTPQSLDLGREFGHTRGIS